MTTRRYADGEVREIFSLATAGDDTAERSLPAEPGGLTLEDLKLIGQEAGIAPARIAQAAASLDARGTPASLRRSLGMPVGVSRVVDLPRAPTDREWERLVSVFRTTFGVPGQVTSSGRLRQWTHGNLNICVEPTEDGERLRLSTHKGDAQALNSLGMVLGGMAVLMSAVVAASGKPEKALVVLGMFGGMALAAFGANLVRLPRWARERERQMAAVAEHTVALLRGGAS